MFYLVQFSDDPNYQTFHADDYKHAYEQASDSAPDWDITAIFQCIELDLIDGRAIFPHEADDLCSHEPNGESVTGAVIICDICGRRDTDNSYPGDWNGETGNHISCEQDANKLCVNHGMYYCGNEPGCTHSCHNGIRT